MKRILTAAAVLLSLALCHSVSAQNGYQVKGVVIDATGPVIGATVMEKGTTNGTSTGLDGDYILNVSGPQAVVEISCIGYATQSFPASSVPATVTLSEDTEFLDDVVVIGYGSISRKEVSSSIVQIESKDFVKGSMNNAMELLSGKVAGLNVTNVQAANPNSSSSLQVRGATSIKAGNEPLVIIDGVPGGSIRNIAPQDIESMTVLKDAASAAIYGTRGANGVILVTTKKGSGEVGTARVTYDSYFGTNFAKDIPDVLTADEYRRSLRGTDFGYNTDWYRMLLRDFSYENNQYLSVDGGMENGSYNASVNYKKATGLDLTDAREEFGARLAVEQKLFKNRLQLNIGLNGRRVNEVYGNDGMFDTALSLNPTMPVYNEDGSFYQPTNATGIRNPYAEMTQNTSEGARLYLLANAAAKLNLVMTSVHSLSTTLSYSLNYDDYKTNYYTPSNSGESFWSNYSGRAQQSYSKYYTNHLEWLWNYTMSIDAHTVNAVAGYTFEEYHSENFGAANMGFTYDDLLYNDLRGGTYLKEGKADMWSGKEMSRLVGVFARVNYNFKNILFASASIRREGSSKFGPEHKWGNFPAASLAWEMANMKFMQGATWVNSLKPRVSFGITGRSDFGAYQSLATYSSSGSYLMDNILVTGYAPSLNANPMLGWEKLVSVNLGVDFVFLDNRIRGSIDLFDRQSRDLLYTYTAPQPPYVHSNILVNVGTTDNKGVELSLEADVLSPKSAFQWTTGVNMSVGTTVLSKLSNDVYNAAYVELYQKPGVGTSEFFFRTEEGSKVGQFYGYEFAGADEKGNLMVYDNDGNPVIASKADPSWKRYIGNGTPKMLLAWNNTFRYKGWDLNLAFNGAFGHEIFNMRRYGMGLRGIDTSSNVYANAYTTYKDVLSSGGVISTFFLQKGDWFKLQSATLGYNFNTSNWQYVKNLRIYCNAKNLFTLTAYDGTDPSFVTTNGLTPSVDTNGAYPLALQVCLGVVASF